MSSASFKAPSSSSAPFDKRALKRRVRRDFLLERGVRGLPRIPALEDVGEIPLESIVDRRTIAQRRCGGGFGGREQVHSEIIA